jgi:hypothetical protein
MAIFISMARLLLRTEDNIATPCSEKAIGKYLAPPQLEVTICDLKLLNSSLVSSNILGDVLNILSFSPSFLFYRFNHDDSDA